MLFREIILISGGPLWKVKSYTILIEFQIRGSTHMPSFFGGELNPRKHSGKTINDYSDFLDLVLSVNLRLEEMDPWIFKLVNTYQIYSQSKSITNMKIRHIGFIMVNFFQIEL